MSLITSIMGMIGMGGKKAPIQNRKPGPKTQAQTSSSNSSKQAPLKPAAQAGASQARRSNDPIGDPENLPQYEVVASTFGGEFEVAREMQKKLAILIAGKVAFFVVDKSEFNQNQHLSLKKQVTRKGYTLGKDFVALDSLISIIYSRDTDARAEANVAKLKDSNYKSMVEQIVDAAVSSRTTDIHMEPRLSGTKTGMIKFRIDSILRDHKRMAYDDLAGIAGYIYTFMADDNTRSEAVFNEKRMQSCSFSTVSNGKNFKVRYQSVRVNGGFDVIMRLLPLDLEEKGKSLHDLGYSDSHVIDLTLASKKSNGVIIVAGVTNSGKSTTLKTMMTMGEDMGAEKSYSIEDPVEYIIPGVSQINVQRSSSDDSGKNNFLESMRVIMRADPDTIMVGEVRDIDSCAMLQTMIQSGHRVMTTVHASSAIEIPDRLDSKEMGLSRHTMSTKSFFSALIYQRLLPVLCPHCKVPARDVLPDSKIKYLEKKFKVNAGNMFCALDNEKGAHGAACPHCKGFGVKGVTVSAEVIPPSSDFLKLIRDRKDYEAELLWRSSRQASFDEPDTTGKTAFEHGLYKVLAGQVDLSHLESNFVPIEKYELVNINTNVETKAA